MLVTFLPPSPSAPESTRIAARKKADAARRKVGVGRLRCTYRLLSPNSLPILIVITPTT